MFFKLLTMDIVGGGGHPAQTTPDTNPSACTSNDFAWILIAAIIIVLIAVVIFAIYRSKSNKNKNVEQAPTENTAETASPKICCPKCNCNKIKFETETHKDKIYIKAICEDCGNLWLLN